MKPYYSDKMLLETSVEELYTLRRAVGHMTDLYSYETENGTRGLFDKGVEYKKLYDDITEIITHIPF